MYYYLKIQDYLFDDFEMNEILNFLIKEKLTLINNFFCQKL